MQLITSLLPLLLTTQAAATIILGETAASGGPKDRNVAWLKGDNPCTSSNYAFISALGVNPCDKKFKLADGKTYHLEKCGSAAIEVRKEDGGLKATCKRASGWTCNGGGVFAEKTWEC